MTDNQNLGIGEIPAFMQTEIAQWSRMRQQFTQIMMFNRDISLSTASDLRAYQIALQLKKPALLKRYEDKYVTKEPSAVWLKNFVENAVHAFQGKVGKVGRKGDEDVAAICRKLPEDIALIQNHLEHKKLSLDFVNAWARLRMVDATLQMILDEVAPSQFDRAYSATGIESNQYWYILWVKDLLDSGFCSEIRFAYIAMGEIVYDMVQNPQILPTEIDPTWMISWLKKMLAKKQTSGENNDGKQENRDVLTNGFSVKELSNINFEKNLQEARKWAKYLPPVGVEYYPGLKLPTCKG